MPKFPLTFPFSFSDSQPQGPTRPNPNTSPILYNLVPGQYQLGSRVIGRGTTVRVESCDIKPYDQNNQDYQVSRADEITFGEDSLKPSTIELTFDVINNRLRPGYEDLIPYFWEEMPKIEDFSYLWRNDKNRKIAGSMNAIYICGKDGLTRAVFGRPGQFTYSKQEEYDEFTQVLAEFRRNDTLAYTAVEAVQELTQNSQPVYLMRETGDGPDTWLRLLLVGPLTHPIITIGDQQIELNYTIEEGNAVEISSYPWQRRAVDANGVNLAANLIGKTQYLDKLVLPYMSPIALKWTSNEVNTMVPVLGNNNWAEDIDGYSMFAPPPGFTQIHGKTIVRFDLFNFSLAAPLTITPRKYLGAGVLQTKCANIYSAQRFNTASQRAQAQLVDSGLWLGQSVLGIMTNADMSQLVGVMCDNQILNQHWLRIVSGSWDNLTVRASWQNPNILGFNEHNHIGIEYDPATKTYTALFHDGISDWQEVCSWIDDTEIISTGTANRFQSFIFDAGGGLGILQGNGFCNIVAYDTAQEPEQTGQVFLMWRDSWSTVG